MENPASQRDSDKSDKSDADTPVTMTRIEIGSEAGYVLYVSEQSVTNLFAQLTDLFKVLGPPQFLTPSQEEYIEDQEYPEDEEYVEDEYDRPDEDEGGEDDTPSTLPH